MRMDVMDAHESVVYRRHVLAVLTMGTPAASSVRRLSPSIQDLYWKYPASPVKQHGKVR